MLSKRGRCLQVKKVVTVKPYLSLLYICTYMYMKIVASMEIDRDFFSSSPLLLRAQTEVTVVDYHCITTVADLGGEGGGGGGNCPPPFLDLTWR